MRWTSLGHAAWLAEAGGLRILFDPILGDTLHGGVHVVHPPRTIHPEALRPDVLVISHVHPDHFDVPSLARLAVLAPEAPLLTADPLVAEAATALGFQATSVLPAGRVLELGGATLITTPSLAPIPEWGVVVSDASGVVWNQVDSVLDASTVHAVREGLAGVAQIEAIDVGLIHACPLREIQAVTAGDLAFPFGGWAEKLATWRALEARALVPASAGFRHAAPFAWRDAHVFPTTDDAVARDLEVAAPGVAVRGCPPGSTLILEGDTITIEAGSPLATPRTPPPLAAWSPLSIPPVIDPALEGQTPQHVRGPIEAWIRDALVPAIGQHTAALPITRPIRLVLDVVLPDQGHEVHTFEAHDGRVAHHRSQGIDPDHDAVVIVASSMLADVIEGRRHWGEPLLAGLLRGARRLAALPPFFPYWALSYPDSVARWVRWQVEQLTRRPAPPAW